VPPARPEVNPLASLLRRQGSVTLYFPALEPRYPSSWDSLDRALRQREQVDWIVFSGSNAVHHWIERAGELGIDPVFPRGPRIAAIGHGAARALRTDGREPDHAPDRHVAADVAAGLPGPSDVHMLLVRVEGASDALPTALQAMGARVGIADGYCMALRASAREAQALGARVLDVVALASPTAVRYLARGAELAGVELASIIGDAAIASVGEATSREAVAHGMEPTLEANGHIADLAASIARWWPDRPLHRLDLADQADAFITAWSTAHDMEQQTMVDEGADLARRLRHGAMDLGYSRATEFDPRIRQYEQLADAIEGLTGI